LGITGTCVLCVCVCVSEALQSVNTTGLLTELRHYVSDLLCVRVIQTWTVHGC
jgi:hypothetical protein